MTIGKIIASLVLIIIFSGCSQLSFGPPSISDENQYFENKYFSIDYPKDWAVSQSKEQSSGTEGGGTTPLEVLSLQNGGRYTKAKFYDPDYPEYFISIVFSEDSTHDISDSVLIIQAVCKEQFRKSGFSRISQSDSKKQLDGIPARLTVIKGENNSNEMAQFVSILLSKNNVLFSIYYLIKKDFSESVKQRFETIVNSVHVK